MGSSFHSSLNLITMLFETDFLSKLLRMLDSIINVFELKNFPDK